MSGDPQDFENYVDNDYKRATVWTFVKNDSTTHADEIANNARAIIATSFPPGVAVQMGGSLPTRNSMLTSGKAILLVAISILSGYAVLQASEFAFYNQLSNMVTATMLISAFFALFFLRALTMLFKPRFIFGDRRDALFAQVAAVGGGR